MNHTLPGERPAELVLLSHGFQAEYEVGFANGAAANGLDVLLVSSDGTLSHRLDPRVHALNLRGSQQAVRSRWRKLGNVLRYGWAYRRLAHRWPQAVFHFNGLFTLRKGWGVLPEALWARWVIRHWWLSVHNLLPHDDANGLNRRIFAWVYRWPERLVVHTEAMKRALVADYRVPPERVLVVEHGIDQFQVPQPGDRAHLCQRYALPASGTLLLLFGHLVPYKGVDVLIRAAGLARLPAATTVLILGRVGSAGYRRVLDEALATVGCPGRVVLVDGFVADDDVPALLRGADAMLLPYRHIDQSGVLFTARSAGLPVLVTDVGSLREYVVPGQDVLVDRCEAAALARGLEVLVEQLGRVDRQACVAAARRWAWAETLRPYAAAVRHRKEARPA